MTPPVTRALLLLNLAVQAGLTLAGTAAAQWVDFQAGLIPARLTGAAALPGAIVPPAMTLVTALFVHGGWLHLGMNALFLFVIARFVEPLFGPGKFLALYLLGGVAGGLAQVLVAPGSQEPVIGASGAISAVFGAYVMRFAARGAGAGRAGGETAAALRFALAWIGLQLLTRAALSGGEPGAPGLNVAIWAHIGGFLTGLAIGARRG